MPKEDGKTLPPNTIWAPPLDGVRVSLELTHWRIATTMSGSCPLVTRFHTAPDFVIGEAKKEYVPVARIAMSGDACRTDGLVKLKVTTTTCSARNWAAEHSCMFSVAVA